MGTGEGAERMNFPSEQPASATVRNQAGLDNH